MKLSAGILLFRRSAGGLEVFLAHPGGPYFAKKDEGAWGIPKGLIDPGEDPLDAALREFAEEIGIMLDPAGAIPLGSITQKGGKVVQAWAIEGNADPALVVSNTCEIEWPPRSGRRMEIPEVDRAEWFSILDARRKIKPAQEPLLDRLVDANDRRFPTD